MKIQGSFPCTHLKIRPSVRHTALQRNVFLPVRLIKQKEKSVLSVRFFVDDPQPIIDQPANLGRKALATALKRRYSEDEAKI